MVGHLGAAPSISPPRTARIAVFLVPDEKWWSHGDSHPDLRNAIASSCCWTMAPKWTRTPDSHRVRAGLQAAASTISASRAF